jgi:uncharacterized protein (DUF1800 family)
MLLSQMPIRFIAAALCLTLVSPLGLAAPLPASHADSPDRVLHTLNRFTFGPRPGDAAAVRAMGVDAWFERQLNPAKIDDSVFESRLAEFPAMQLSEQQLLRRYPSPALLRRFAKEGGGSLPHDPIEHAIWADQIAFYNMAQSKRATKADATSAPASPAMAGEMSMSPDEKKMEMAEDTAAGKLEASVERMPQARVESLLAQPADQRFRSILTLSPTDLVALRKALRPATQPRLLEGFTAQQKEVLLALQGTNRMITVELLASRILRDIYSERQLEAVMTDFWLNHFNVYIRKNQLTPATLPSYERETIRAHALGRFEDLLVATAQSPAMLLYLDNATSTGPHSPFAQRAGFARSKKGMAGLNENYARELMELHTLGVNGGYTQRDVTEVAKVFTGWTIDRGQYTGDGDSGFTYNDRRHEPGPKQVLGHLIMQSGESEGRQVLHLLATSPATAQFISRKLAIRFVSDNPSQSLVDKMAKSFLSSNGDIKAVLRTMFHAQEFWTPEVYRAKLKTPIEYVASAARASNAQIANPQPFVQALERLGMPLYGAQPPTGYKWNSETWLSSAALVNRMNFALVLSTNRLEGTRIDWDSALQRTQPHAQNVALIASDFTPEVAAKERSLEGVLLGFPASAQTRQTVLSQQDDSVAQQAAREFRLNEGTNSPEENSMQQPAVQKMKGQKGSRTNPGRFGGGLQPLQSVDDPQAAAMAGLLLGSPEFQRR